MSDPLARMWVHVLTVEPFTGSSAYGDVYGDPYTQSGLFEDAAVWQAGVIVAAGRFAYPRTAPRIPPQSRVTLPADVFGTNPDGSARTYLVKTATVADAGGLPLPAHQIVEVE